MDFFETKTQFILKVEGIENSKDYPEYKIRFSRDMNCYYKTEFPQFELTVKTGGGWGFSSYFRLNYKGFDFRPKFSGDKEGFLLNLLNDLKKGNYDEKLITLISNSVNESSFEFNFKDLLELLKTPNNKAELYSQKISSLEQKNKTLEDENSKVQELKTKNKELTEKIENIKSILK